MRVERYEAEVNCDSEIGSLSNFGSKGGGGSVFWYLTLRM